MRMCTNTNTRLVVFDLDDTLYDPRTNAMFPGVGDMLAALKENKFAIGLASYNAYAPDVLRDCGIGRYFEFVEHEDLVRSAQILRRMQAACEHVVENDWKWSSCVANDKRCMLRNILTRSGVPPEDAFFVDDQVRYLKTAEEIGLRTFEATTDGRWIPRFLTFIMGDDECDT